MFLPSVCGHYLNKGDNDLAALLHPLAGDDAFVQTPAAKRAEAALDLLDRFLAGLRALWGRICLKILKRRESPATGWKIF